MFDRLSFTFKRATERFIDVGIRQGQLETFEFPSEIKLTFLRDKRRKKKEIQQP